MLTIDTLQKDMMAAMKAGDTLKKSALSSAISAIKKTAIDKGCRDNITEELIIDVCRKEVKILNEQIETCTKGKPELKQEFETRRAVIESYLPQLITDEKTIKDMVYQLCTNIELTKTNRGLVMKTIMPQFKGKVDMKIAQEVINTILN